MNIANRRHAAEVASGHRFVLPPLESGKDLFNRNVRSGNCWEMCHVSAYLTNRKFPAARITRANLFLPGDHYLIIAGDIPRRGPISSWRNQVMSSSSSVIDIWMGISCDTKDYPDRARQKLNRLLSRDLLISVILPFRGAGMDPITFKRWLSEIASLTDPQRRSWRDAKICLALFPRTASVKSHAGSFV
jgi:hypothetical protein